MADKRHLIDMLVFNKDSYKIIVSNFIGDYIDKLPTFDAIYLQTDEYRPISTQSIELIESNRLLKRILLGATGGGTGVWENTSLLNNDRLVTCCSNTVFCISVPDLELLWKTEADLATCFCIYHYKNDYIVHGELEISRLDINGNIVWQTGGADIFVTIEGNSNITLLEDRIVAIDFGYNKYEFDYNGNLIAQLKA